MTSPLCGARSRTSPTALVTRRLADIFPSSGGPSLQEPCGARGPHRVTCLRLAIADQPAQCGERKQSGQSGHGHAGDLAPSARTAGTSRSPLGNPQALSPLHPASTPVRPPAPSISSPAADWPGRGGQWWRDGGRQRNVDRGGHDQRGNCVGCRELCERYCRRHRAAARAVASAVAVAAELAGIDRQAAGPSHRRALPQVSGTIGGISG